MKYIMKHGFRLNFHASNPIICVLLYVLRIVKQPNAKKLDFFFQFSPVQKLDFTISLHAMHEKRLESALNLAKRKTATPQIGGEVKLHYFSLAIFSGYYVTQCHVKIPYM